MRATDRLVSWTEQTGFILLCGGIFLLGMYRGLQVYELRIDLLWVAVEVFLLDAVGSAFMFSSFLVVSSVLFWRWMTFESPQKQSGPACAAVVPAYQEVETLPNIVSSLLASTYEPLSVVIACQREDEETVTVAQELAAQHDAVRVVVNREGPQSKPGNVNYAVEQTDEPLIAVFDADSAVDPRFVSAAVAKIAEADIVQGRVLSRPSGWLESVSYYEDVLIGAMSKALMYVFTDFRMALSNGTLMTREAYESVQGFNDVAADDFDFALNCYRAGINVELLWAYPVIREPAHTLRDWWGQRKRWMTSYVEVLHRTLSDIRSFRSYQDIVSLGIVGGSVLGSALMLMLASKIVVLLVLGAEQVYLLPIFLLITVAAAFHVRDSWHGAVGMPGPAVLLTPIIFPFFALVAVKSLLAYPLTWNGDWYHTARQT